MFMICLPIKSLAPSLAHASSFLKQLILCTTTEIKESNHLIMYRVNVNTETYLYLKVEPLRKRLTAEGRRVMSVFTDLWYM